MATNYTTEADVIANKASVNAEIAAKKADSSLDWPTLLWRPILGITANNVVSLGFAASTATASSGSGLTAAQIAQLNSNATAIAGITTQVGDIDARVGTVEVNQLSDVEANVTLLFALATETMPTDGSQYAQVLALDPSAYAQPAIVKVQYTDGTTCHRTEGNPLAWVEFARQENLHSLIALNASSFNNLGLAQSILANDITKFKSAQDRTGSEYTLTFEDVGFVLEVDNNIIIPAMPAGQEKAIYSFINSGDVDRTISGGAGAGVTIEKGATIIEAGGFLSILIKTADGASTVTVNGGGHA